MIVVYFTKGLGDVVADELEDVAPGLAIGERTDRFIVLDPPAAQIGLIESALRTADDLRTVIAGPASVADEAGFVALVGEGGERARAILSREGRAEAAPWSVTVSARKPVWRRKPTFDPAPTIAEHLGAADVAGTERMPVDVRLQADVERMHLALNRGRRVVGRRESAPARLGALRPAVGAALVRMVVAAAEPRTAERGIYDPFAGTGTIVIEALRRSLPAFASDIDPEAVRLTRARLADLASERETLAAGLDDAALLRRVFVHDIRAGLPTRVNARLIAGNLPWGDKVQLDRRTELFDALGPIAAETVAAGAHARC